MNPAEDYCSRSSGSSSTFRTSPSARISRSAFTRRSRLRGPTLFSNPARRPSREGAAVARHPPASDRCEPAALPQVLSATQHRCRLLSVQQAHRRCNSTPRWWAVTGLNRRHQDFQASTPDVGSARRPVAQAEPVASSCVGVSANWLEWARNGTIWAQCMRRAPRRMNVSAIEALSR